MNVMREKRRVMKTCQAGRRRALLRSFYVNEMRPYLAKMAQVAVR